MRSFHQRMGWVAIFLMAVLVSARADTLTWTAGAGDWFDAANWTNWGDPENTRVPAAAW